MLEEVARIAAEAGRIAAGRCDTAFNRWEKKPGELVCDIDLEVDAFLRERLGALDPEAGWLSEETLDASDRIERRRLWVVDPIDGTRDYLRGRSGWAVSVALVEDRVPTIGVLAAPARGELWTAERGRGAWRNGEPLKASRRTELGGARVPAEQLPPADADLVAVAKPNSIALRIALVAAGEADLVATLKWGFEWDIAAAALIATETRPRCDEIESGAIVNLRGPGDTDDSDRLVSIRLWARKGKVNSVTRRPLAATARVREKMEAGRILDPGDLVAAFARAISKQLDPEVAGLGDRLDDHESALDDPRGLYRLRTAIARIRSDAIAYRRFVAPNRDALETLADIDFEWLAEEDRLHIREAADRFARMTEELEAVRERAALLHEQLTDLRGEQMESRSLLISIVALIFLPLTFITGLLGMNVEGIPYAKEPWAFWGVVGFCVLIGLVVLAYFARIHWLRR